MHKNNFNYLWGFLLLGNTVLATGCSINHEGSNWAFGKIIEQSSAPHTRDVIQPLTENEDFVNELVDNWSENVEELRQYVNETAEALNMTAELEYALLIMCDIIHGYDDEERERFIQSFASIKTLQENVSSVRRKLDTEQVIHEEELIELVVARVTALPAWLPYLSELQRLHNLTDEEQKKDEEDSAILALIHLVRWVHEYRHTPYEALSTLAMNQATDNPLLQPFAEQIGRYIAANIGLQE